MVIHFYQYLFVFMYKVGIFRGRCALSLEIIFKFDYGIFSNVCNFSNFFGKYYKYVHTNLCVTDILEKVKFM